LNEIKQGLEAQFKIVVNTFLLSLALALKITVLDLENTNYWYDFMMMIRCFYVVGL